MKHSTPAFANLPASRGAAAERNPPARNASIDADAPVSLSSVADFLALKRAAEPSVEVSVARWCALHRKQYGKHCRTSVYLDNPLLDDIQRTANAQGVSFSSLVQQAWELSKTELRTFVDG